MREYGAPGENLHRMRCPGVGIHAHGGSCVVLLRCDEKGDLHGCRSEHFDLLRMRQETHSNAAADRSCVVCLYCDEASHLHGRGSEHFELFEVRSDEVEDGEPYGACVGRMGVRARSYYGGCGSGCQNLRELRCQPNTRGGEIACGRTLDEVWGKMVVCEWRRRISVELLGVY